MIYRYDLERLRAACEEADRAAYEFERHEIPKDLAIAISSLRAELQHFIYATL